MRAFLKLPLNLQSFVTKFSEFSAEPRGLSLFEIGPTGLDPNRMATLLVTVPQVLTSLG